MVLVTLPESEILNQTKLLHNHRDFRSRLGTVNISKISRMGVGLLSVALFRSEHSLIFKTSWTNKRVTCPPLSETVKRQTYFTETAEYDRSEGRIFFIHRMLSVCVKACFPFLPTFRITTPVG